MILLVVPLVQCLLLTYRSRGECPTRTKAKAANSRIIVFDLCLNESIFIIVDDSYSYCPDPIHPVHIPLHSDTAICHCRLRLACRITDRRWRYRNRYRYTYTNFHPHWKLDRRPRRMGRRGMAGLESGQGGSIGRSRSRCFIRVWSREDSSELLRTDQGGRWVS